MKNLIDWLFSPWYFSDRLDQIEADYEDLSKKVDEEMNALQDAITAAAAEADVAIAKVNQLVTTVKAEAALITNLTAEVANLKNSGADPATVQAITDKLTASVTAMQAALDSVSTVPSGSA